MTILADDTVRARKRHRCFLCCCSIWPGEKYRCTSQVYDGRAYRLKEHPECARVGQLYYDSWYDEGYTGESTEEGMRSAYHDMRRYVYLVGDMTRDERKVWMRLRQSQARYEIRHAMKHDRWLKEKA